MNHSHIPEPTLRPSSRASRRLARLLLATVTIGVVVAPGAGAGGPDSVASYSGCVRVSGDARGQLAAVAQGNTPSRPCAADEAPIKLSSGDITSVAAGPGLRITSGDNFGLIDGQGAVDVAITPSYRLPQDCTNGDLPQFKQRQWICTEKPTIPVVPHAISGRAAGPALISDEYANIAGPLSIPAGSWSIVAKVGINEDTDSPKTIVQCRLDVTGTPNIDEAFLANDAATASGMASGQLTLIGITTQAQAFKAVVACNDRGMGNDWMDLQIVATPTGGSDHVAL